MTLAEIVGIIKDIVLVLAAFVAAYVGLRGLSAWRRQLFGNAEYQLAKNILTCVYELRDRVIQVRSPFISYSREPDLPKETLETLNPREKEWQAYAQAYQKRWDPIPLAKSRLDVSVWEAEAVWRRDLVTKTLELNRMLNVLLLNIQEHVQSRNPANRPDPAEQELSAGRRAVVFWSSKNDKFGEELNAIVTDIEQALRSHVKARYRG